MFYSRGKDLNMQVEESSKSIKTRGSIFLEIFCKLFIGKWRVEVLGTTNGKTPGESFESL
jgi:hypothetical protein